MQQVVFFLTHHLWNTWHVIHDHVKIFHILERKMKLNDPFRVGMGHNIPFLPEKGRIGPLDLNINNYFNNIELLFFLIKLIFTISNLLRSFIAYTFLVDLCLTSWTCPKAPLPMTLMTVKSSCLTLSLPISSATLTSAKESVLSGY